MDNDDTAILFRLSPRDAAWLLLYLEATPPRSPVSDARKKLIVADLHRQFGEAEKAKGK